MVGGGSGHEPTFIGYVGRGLADAVDALAAQGEGDRRRVVLAGEAREVAGRGDAARVDGAHPDRVGADREAVEEHLDLGALAVGCFDYLKASGRQPGQFLFPGRGKSDRNMTTRQYARLLSEWLTGIGLDACVE